MDYLELYTFVSGKSIGIMIPSLASNSISSLETCIEPIFLSEDDELSGQSSSRKLTQWFVCAWYNDITTRHH